MKATIVPIKKSTPNPVALSSSPKMKTLTKVIVNIQGSTHAKNCAIFDCVIFAMWFVRTYTKATIAPIKKMEPNPVVLSSLPTIMLIKLIPNAQISRHAKNAAIFDCAIFIGIISYFISMDWRRPVESICSARRCPLKTQY